MWTPSHVPAESLPKGPFDPFDPCTDFPPVTGWLPFVPDRESCADGTVEVACKRFWLEEPVREACFRKASVRNMTSSISPSSYAGHVCGHLCGHICPTPATGWLCSVRAGSCADGAVETTQAVLSTLIVCQLVYCWHILLCDSSYLPPATGWLCSFRAGSCADGAVKRMQATWRFPTECQLAYCWHFLSGGNFCDKGLAFHEGLSTGGYGYVVTAWAMDNLFSCSLAGCCVGHPGPCGGHSLSFSPIWDDTPYTLAGGHKLHLYRQNVLLRLCVLTNFLELCPGAFQQRGIPFEIDFYGQDSSSSNVSPLDELQWWLTHGALYVGEPQPDGSNTPFLGACCRLKGQRGGCWCDTKGHVPSESCLRPHGTAYATGAYDQSALSPCAQSSQAAFFIIYNFRAWLEGCFVRCISFLWIACLWTASEFQGFLTTMALLSMVYCFKLWAYAASLKGGQRNWDPFIRSSRALCSGCPLRLAWCWTPRLSPLRKSGSDFPVTSCGSFF